MKAILLLGAPGAGKGTVAGTVVKQRGYEQFSTGDMLRAAVRNDDALGRLARTFMERGDLVPDDVIENMVRARIDAGPRDQRYLFDGFPRTVIQAGMMDRMLAAYDSRINAVIQLVVDDEVIVRRIAGRRSCRQCGAVYNIHSLAPAKEGLCDRCGGALYQRADDVEATVRNRLSVYRLQTEPLVDLYGRAGLVHRIDATDRDATDRAVLSVIDGAGG